MKSDQEHCAGDPFSEKMLDAKYLSIGQLDWRLGTDLESVTETDLSRDAADSPSLISLRGRKLRIHVLPLNYNPSPRMLVRDSRSLAVPSIEKSNAAKLSFEAHRQSAGLCGSHRRLSKNPGNATVIDLSTGLASRSLGIVEYAQGYTLNPFTADTSSQWGIPRGKALTMAERKRG